MKFTVPQYQTLFVYGTLRRDVGGDLCHILENYADFLDYGVYQGKLYRVGKYPGVIASSDPNDRVYGEVYRLHDPCRLLSRLDLYEECAPGFPRPTEYVRDVQFVHLLNGEVIPVWMYLYNRPIDQLELITSGDFAKAYW
jgi:gamma-glutamylcyclotransferase (GGCT)/AIG2-like uncharacterized protein YtfP